MDCSPTIITRPIELTNQEFRFNDFQVENEADLCGEVATGHVRFDLINTWQAIANNDTPSLTFLLDDSYIYQTGDKLSFDERTQTYQITDIAPGDHRLIVIATTASASCQIEKEFTVTANANPIEFSGNRQYAINVCDQGVDIVVNPTDISGGKPFSGQLPYDLQWTYYPDATTNATTQTLYGSTISQAQAGLYELIITDANGCHNNSEEPIVIEVNAPGVDPITVYGTLQDPDSEQSSPTKVLPIQCDSEQGGSIGIAVVGGLRPFEINWYKQNTDTASIAYTLLPNFKNKTQLTRLEAANYRVEIQSVNESCDGQTSVYTHYEEVITVEDNPDLFIVSGPYIDEDICSGVPGRIAVEVFDNNQGELFFYYDGVRVQEEDTRQVNEQTHTLLIEDPKESATLLIINEQGCSVSKQLNLDIGEANFDFTSVTLENSNLILARENIVFDNTSTGPYVKAEWDFGDFSTPKIVLNTVTSTKISYSYPISGTYYVTLRIYNEVGCYTEITKQIIIGKGYNIMVPNVFSPNNDGINDLFRPLTTGLSSIQFSVYDNSGNLIYNENVSEPDPDELMGISIAGWDGKNAPQSPYFIYTVEGLLHDGVTRVEKTGTFLLLR